MKFKFGDKVVWEGFEAVIVDLIKDKGSKEGIAIILIEAPFPSRKEQRQIAFRNKEGFRYIENVVLLSDLREVKL